MCCLWTVDLHILWTTNTVPAEFTDILRINENEDDDQDENELDDDDHDDDHDDYDINPDDYS